MNIAIFWRIIDEARNENGWEAMATPLARRLATFEDTDIFLWHNILWEYQQLSYKSKLWAAAYVINGGCSDDGFDYFRGWLTAQGRAVFEQALNDPDSLAGIDSCEENIEFERILSIAWDAYSEKGDRKGDYGDFWDACAGYSLTEEMKKDMQDGIVYAVDIDAEWNDEGIECLVPKLCEKFS